MCDNQMNNESEQEHSSSNTNQIEEKGLTFPTDDSKYYAFELKGGKDE